MVLKRLAIVLVLLFATTSAQAQTNPLGAGYSFANGQLYVQISPSLQSLTLPFSISVNIKAPTIPPGGVTSALVSSMPSLGTSGGFFVGYNTGAASTFNLMSYIQPGTAVGGGFSCTHQGQICWRYPFVDDGNLHNVCVRWTPTQGFLYLDGIVRDQTSVVGAYSSTPDLYWLLGNNYPSNATMYDVRAYSGDIGAAGCVQLANNALAGVYPTTGALSTGMVLHLPMDSTAGPCTNVSTAWTCPDVSGNVNSAVNGTLAPVVTITAPSAGMVSGTTTNVQVTCTLSAGTCAQVCYYIDGYLLAACPTTSPTYTYVWNTQNTVDGSHTLTAVGYSVSGLTGTSAPVSVTVNNTLPAVTRYFNSSTGNDSYNCLSATFTSGSNGPCLTITKLQSFTFRGGDTYNLAGTGFTSATGIQICGAAAPTSITIGVNSFTQCGGQQNYFPSSSVLTIQGPGGCVPLSGSASAAPTNCATITRSGTGTLSAVMLWNASNVTVQNTAQIGTYSNTSIGNGTAAFDVSAHGSVGLSTNVTINNNYVLNYSWGAGSNVAESQYFGKTNASCGVVTNLQILDNYITATSTGAYGASQGIRFNCHSQGIVQGNLQENAGGFNNDQGNGLMSQSYPNPLGSASPLIFQFNVTRFNGGNYSGGAGGPYSLYSNGGDNTLFQFNEEYAQGCWVLGCAPRGTGPDNGGADIDTGSTHILTQYNYIHDNIQPGSNCMLFFVGSSAGQSGFWGDNYYRFNICENYFAGIQDNDTGTFHNTIGTGAAYNNTLSSNTGNVSGSSGNPPQLIGTCIYQGTGSPSLGGNNICINASPTNLFQWHVFSATCDPGDYNDYYSINGTAYDRWSLSNGLSTSFAAWKMACSTGDQHSLNVNPGLAGTPETGGTCWPGGTTVPGGPQNAPSAGCPAVYQLGVGSQLIGAGRGPITPPSSVYLPATQDYYGKSLPYPSAGSPTGSGYPIGASAGP